MCPLQRVRYKPYWVYMNPSLVKVARGAAAVRVDDAVHIAGVVRVAVVEELLDSDLTSQTES